MKFVNHFLIGLIVLPGVAFAQYSGSVAPPAEMVPGFEAITEPFAKDTLSFLAGPSTQGRGTGQPGFQVAADFVAGKFKEFGLKPVGDNGTYFQNLTFYGGSPVPDSVNLSVQGSTVQVGGDQDVTIANLSTGVDVYAPVVLLQLTKGSELPASVSLTNKIVMANAASVDKLMRQEILQQHPVCLLLVDEKVVPSAPQDRSVRLVKPTKTAFVGSIRREAAALLLEGLQPGSSARLAEKPTQTGAIFPTKLLHVTAKYKSEEIYVPNVVGLLEGSDPDLKAEIVGIGAHLDHLGVNRGVVYPGADDDGSGSTAVISIARAFSVSPLKPKRSILFMTFCGEEMGLLGSNFYSNHPIFPHKQMVSELQMDMIARNSYGAQNGDPNRMDVASENVDTIRLVGSKRISTELDKTIQDENRYIGFRFRYDAEDVYTRSDHYNFARQGIPIAFLFDGFTPDYHQPSDTVDKINFTKLVSCARLYFLTAMTLANQPNRPKSDVPQGK